jgi:phage gpG-like protein
MGFAQLMTLGSFVQQARSGAFTPNVPGDGGRTLNPQIGQVIGTVMVTDVHTRFTTQTAPDGSAWAPLKFARPQGGAVPLNNTGILRASFTSRVEGNDVIVATTHPGAALQNFGGTVRAKNVKYLTIPLTKEAVRSGSARRFPRPLRFVPLKGGNGLLVEGRGKDGKGTAHYFLTKETKHVPRTFMGLSKEAAGDIEQVLIDETLNGWLSVGTT